MSQLFDGFKDGCAAVLADGLAERVAKRADITAKRRIFFIPLFLFRRDHEVYDLPISYSCPRFCQHCQQRTRRHYFVIAAKLLYGPLDV